LKLLLGQDTALVGGKQNKRPSSSTRRTSQDAPGDLTDRLLFI